MSDILKPHIIELSVIAWLVWVIAASFAITQQVLQINVLPENLESLSKTMFLIFTMLVLVMTILALQRQLSQIYSVLAELKETKEENTNLGEKSTIKQNDTHFLKEQVIELENE